MAKNKGRRKNQRGGRRQVRNQRQDTPQVQRLPQSQQKAVAEVDKTETKLAVSPKIESTVVEATESVEVEFNAADKLGSHPVVEKKEQLEPKPPALLTESDEDLESADIAASLASSSDSETEASDDVVEKEEKVSSAASSSEGTPDFKFFSSPQRIRQLVEQSRCQAEQAASSSSSRSGFMDDNQLAQFLTEKLLTLQIDYLMSRKSTVRRMGVPFGKGAPLLRFTNEEQCVSFRKTYYEFMLNANAANKTALIQHPGYKAWNEASSKAGAQRLRLIAIISGVVKNFKSLDTNIALSEHDRSQTKIDIGFGLLFAAVAYIDKTYKQTRKYTASHVDSNGSELYKVMKHWLNHMLKHLHSSRSITMKDIDDKVVNQFKKSAAKALSELKTKDVACQKLINELIELCPAEHSSSLTTGGF